VGFPDWEKYVCALILGGNARCLIFAALKKITDWRSIIREWFT
jgi:hypothetical protein